MDKQINSQTKEDTGSKRKVIIGLDISTTCTAVTVMDHNTGELLKLYHVVMNNKKKFPHFWSKVQYMDKIYSTENMNLIGMLYALQWKKAQKDFLQVFLVQEQL